MNSLKILILKDFFKSVSNMPDSEWEQFEKHCKLAKFKKNQVIIQAGDFSSNMGLIISGMVKRSYTSSAGKEFVHYFGRAGQLSGAYSSILMNESSKVDITALEDTEIITFNFREYQNLYPRHICWERISRTLLEKHFIAREQREYQLLMLSASERYTEFLKEYKECHHKITSKDIASFLGITPEAFSRLKKEFKY